MRISDWSSDVCSSDLARSLPGPARTPAAVGRGRDPRLRPPPGPGRRRPAPLRGPALVDAHALAAGLRLAVPVPATALALVVALVVVAFAGLALVSAVAMIRSAATGEIGRATSELQSLMRNSYAVLFLKK